MEFAFAEGPVMRKSIFSCSIRLPWRSDSPCRWPPMPIRITKSRCRSRV